MITKIVFGTVFGNFNLVFVESSTRCHLMNAFKVLTPELVVVIVGSNNTKSFQLLFITLYNYTSKCSLV